MSQRKNPPGGPGPHDESGSPKPPRTRVSGRDRHRRAPAHTDDLLASINAAAAFENPLPLLELASSTLAVLEPARNDPADPQWPGTADRAGFVTALLGAGLPETELLLAAVHALSADELERARIARTLRAELTDAEGLLRQFTALAPYRAVEQSHVLGDGDNLMLGVRTSAGHEFTLVIYVDHNMGTLVKDAFAIPKPLAEVITGMKNYILEPGCLWADMPLAEARSRLREAIDRGAATVPPLETDSWPGVRPLTEAVLRAAPSGGHGYQRPQWSEKQLKALSEGFFNSRFGRALDTEAHRVLLTLALRFGIDSGPGDPMRWSPTAVEIILLDWGPRRIASSLQVMLLLPDLLRAFVGYCHGERGIQHELTQQTLAAIDRYQSDFIRMLHTEYWPEPPLLGPTGALPRPGRDGGTDGRASIEPGNGFEGLMLEQMRRTVGGGKELQNLDSRPLPDEDFDWTRIPADIVDRVAEVLALCDRCCTELLDGEHRTAARRLLARAAAADPAIFRRKGAAKTASGGVCWIIATANDGFLEHGLLVKDMMAYFGIAGSVSQRANVFLAAVGIDPYQLGPLNLGTPVFLVSSFRRRIIAFRDACLDGPSGQRPV